METYLLEKRLKKLIKVKEEILAKEQKGPIGNLRIMKRKNSVHYYLITEKGDTVGKYISVRDNKMVGELAQEDYNRKTLREIEKEIKKIEGFLRTYRPEKVNNIYEKMTEHRKQLINPYIWENLDYAKKWEEENYVGNALYEEEKIYETKNGEMVRTKSEAMIADMYYEMGIIYKYEYPLKLKDGKIRYPDFTLIRLSDGKRIYHEHMGLLENEDYRRKNLLKISEYAEEGICLGSNLIISFETEYCPAFMRSLKKMVESVMNQFSIEDRG